MYHSQYIIDIRLIIHRDITLENYSRLYYKVKRKNKKEEKLRTKYRCDDVTAMKIFTGHTRTWEDSGYECAKAFLTG